MACGEMWQLLTGMDEIQGEKNRDSSLKHGTFRMATPLHGARFCYGPYPIQNSTGVDLMALISWYFKFQIIIDRSPSPKLFPLYFYYQWGRETNDCLVCQLKTTSMWSAFCHHTISEESWLNSCFSCGVDSIFRRRITVKRRCFCVSIFLPTHQGSILGGEGKAWLSWFCRSRGSACMSCWFHHQMSTADLM